MTVVRGYPPNIDEIAAVLPGAKGGKAIFCYGDTIYNPGGGHITPALHAHEEIHSERQGKTVDGIGRWWKRYLDDEQFRFDEELPAHRAEYATYCRTEPDREKRFRYLVTLAKRLSGPLYGGLTSFADAKRAIAAHGAPRAAEGER